MATLHDYGSSIVGLNRALRQLPKEAKAELTEASKDIAQNVADEAQGLAAQLEGQLKTWKFLKGTIKATKSSKPTIKMGGSRRLPKRYQGDPRGGSKATIGDLTFGLEFGGSRGTTGKYGKGGATAQFLPHLGKTGYAMWPAVRGESAETQERYSEALMSALEKM